ncbi:lysozyme [Aurantimonas coralicida]|uniref:lysozyme n=1 Tax=Aurantimonas coralicida TaxID=182270 RepID=UPI001D186B86|nr:lysozyme [Aurantimonas coralicida]MCC4298450.1 lysozyme [Aurantimonas coralicida]
MALSDLLRRLFSRSRSTPVSVPRPSPAPRSKTKSRLVVGGAATALMATVVAFVGDWEGMRHQAYIPIAGDVPTICYGSTKGVRIGDTKTKAECDALFGQELVQFEAGMRKCIRNPDAVPDEVYVAFLSASYNVGVGGFCKSSMARRLNAGDVRGACDALLLWNKSGGRVVQGLVNRRKAERKLCLEGLR